MLLLSVCRKRPTAFSASFLQSAARTPCALMAHNSHTCSLRSIFCQVHAPSENDFDFYFLLTQKTLRGFFCVDDIKIHVILSGARSAQSKDLRTDLLYALNEMPRSIDSLRSLRMTAFCLS